MLACLFSIIGCLLLCSLMVGVCAFNSVVIDLLFILILLVVCILFFCVSVWLSYLIGLFACWLVFLCYLVFFVSFACWFAY